MSISPSAFLRSQLIFFCFESIRWRSVKAVWSSRERCCHVHLSYDCLNFTKETKYAYAGTRAQIISPKEFSVHQTTKNIYRIRCPPETLIFFKYLSSQLQFTMDHIWLAWLSLGLVILEIGFQFTIRIVAHCKTSALEDCSSYKNFVSAISCY